MLQRGCFLPQGDFSGMHAWLFMTKGESWGAHLQPASALLHGGDDRVDSTCAGGCDPPAARGCWPSLVLAPCPGGPCGRAARRGRAMPQPGGMMLLGMGNELGGGRGGRREATWDSVQAGLHLPWGEGMAQGHCWSPCSPVPWGGESTLICAVSPSPWAQAAHPPAPITQSIPVVEEASSTAWRDPLAPCKSRTHAEL